MLLVPNWWFHQFLLLSEPLDVPGTYSAHFHA